MAFDFGIPDPGRADLLGWRASSASMSWGLSGRELCEPAGASAHARAGSC